MWATSMIRDGMRLNTAIRVAKSALPSKRVFLKAHFSRSAEVSFPLKIKYKIGQRRALSVEKPEFSHFYILKT
jgi:hypothetical protein